MADERIFQGAAVVSILAGLGLIVLGSGLVGGTSSASVASQQNLQISSNYENPVSGGTTFAFVDTNQQATWTINVKNAGDVKWKETTLNMQISNSNVVGTTEIAGRTAFECFSEDIGQLVVDSNVCKDDIVNTWNLRYKLPDDSDFMRPEGQQEATIVLPDNVQPGESVEVDLRIEVPKDWEQNQRKILGNVVAVDTNGDSIQKAFIENVNPSPDKQVEEGEYTGSTLQMAGGSFLLVLGLGFLLVRRLE